MTYLALALLLAGGFSPGPGSASSGGYATIQEDGTPLTQRTTLNFTGSAITCSDSGGITVCAVTSGAGNFLEVEVDFGATGSTNASTTVTGQTWVTGTSKIWCVVTGLATADRAEGAEDAMLEGIQGQISNRSAGVGFILKASPRQGNALGKYLFHCSGS